MDWWESVEGQWGPSAAARGAVCAAKADQTCNHSRRIFKKVNNVHDVAARWLWPCLHHCVRTKGKKEAPPFLLSSPDQPRRCLPSRRSGDACTPRRPSPPERPLSARRAPGLRASCPGQPQEHRPRWDAPRPWCPALYPGPWDPGTQAAWWMQRRSTLTFKNLLLSPLPELKKKKKKKRGPEYDWIYSCAPLCLQPVCGQCQVFFF